MAIARQQVKAVGAGHTVWASSVQLPAALLSRVASAAGRALMGSGEGPRSYPREGYPEHELHQIVAARKDRFDGLL